MESSSDNAICAKIVLIGESTVGKTCTIVRYTKGYYNESPPTVVSSYFAKKIEINDKTLKYQIWDTAGQERYRSLTHIYYRGAHGALIFYDVTNRKSFDVVAEWVNNVRTETSNNVCIVIVGNKVDDVDKRVVTTEEGQACADRFGVPFLEISAKSGLNVEEVFNKLGELIIESGQGVMKGPTNDGDKKEQALLTEETRNKAQCGC